MVLLWELMEQEVKKLWTQECAHYFYPNSDTESWTDSFAKPNGIQKRFRNDSRLHLL